MSWPNTVSSKWAPFQTKHLMSNKYKQLHKYNLATKCTVWKTSATYMYSKMWIQLIFNRSPVLKRNWQEHKRTKGVMIDSQQLAHSTFFTPASSAVTNLLRPVLFKQFRLRNHCLSSSEWHLFEPHSFPALDLWECGTCHWKKKKKRIYWIKSASFSWHC